MLLLVTEKGIGEFGTTVCLKEYDWVIGREIWELGVSWRLIPQNGRAMS